MLELFKFVWYWWIFAIFVKFQCENIKVWKIIIGVFSFAYFVYLIIVNVQSITSHFYIPIKYPTLCLNIMIVFIGVSERWEIWKIFVQNNRLSRLVEKTIKNRLIFINLTVGSMIASQLIYYFQGAFR